MYDPTKPYREQILKLIQKTSETPYLSVKKQVVKKKFSFSEYHHTDGIGTKGIYHWEKKSFKNAVLDVLAMNLNDLLLMRAKPYAVLNHLFLPRDDKKAILEIIKHLSEECKKRKIAILGGETAIHNDMKGMELSITMLGFVEDPKENKFRIGDVLIGFGSNGLHSNGFTKIREIFGKECQPEFITPTFIYFEEIFALNKKFSINGMVHITGGAFTKIKDFLINANAVIKRNHKLKPHPIFKELHRKGVSDKEMYKTFNCGIGFILSVNSKVANKILSEIKDFKADIIGKVVSGSGKIEIESAFSNKKVIF
ncbi:MAG: AIR synthase-related protein [bacterium]|nr:AIR synthase-related protein [bacterium]